MQPFSTAREQGGDCSPRLELAQLNGPQTTGQQASPCLVSERRARHNPNTPDISFGRESETCAPANSNFTPTDSREEPEAAAQMCTVRSSGDFQPGERFTRYRLSGSPIVMHW